MARYRLFLANLLLALALAGSLWGRRLEAASWQGGDFLTKLELPFQNWKRATLPLPPDEVAMLQPDSLICYRYLAPQGGAWAELTVIAGHRKRTVHTPDYCMRGEGWETLAEEPMRWTLGNRHVEAMQARVMREGRQLYVTYLFTDGTFSTSSLPRFQTAQIAKRLRLHPPLGALVRIITPISEDRDASKRLADDFAQTVLSPVLDGLERQRLDAR